MLTLTTMPGGTSPSAGKISPATSDAGPHLSPSGLSLASSENAAARTP
jgi:hypothetical protein